MTNYESIKNMTLEQMANKLIYIIRDCEIDCCNCSEHNCDNCMKEYLNSEEIKSENQE